MKDFLKELQEFIDKNSKTYNIQIIVTDWKECGEYSGEDPRPIFDIKLTERALI